MMEKKKVVTRDGRSRGQICCGEGKGVSRMCLQEPKPPTFSMLGGVCGGGAYKVGHCCARLRNT